MTDVQVHNLVRAMHGPYPSAFTYRGETKIEIEKTSLLKETIRGIPGRVPMFKNGAVVVLTKNRGLQVEEISVEGKSLIPEDFFDLGDDLG
jgi:methionyl-tRNA formyltransferase